MAKKAAKSASAEVHESILPLPALVLQHHLPTLEPYMRECENTKHLPHSLLITGTTGSAKRNIAYWLAQWIFCEKSGFSSKPETEPEGLFGSSSLPGDAPTQTEGAN